MNLNFKLIACLIILFTTGCNQVVKTKTPANVNWGYYNGSHSSNKYSELDQINKSNLNDLKLAWSYDIPKAEDQADIKCNPLVIDGVVYANTSENLVAINAVNGEQIWYLDFKKYDSIGNQHSSRGILYWEKREDKRIFKVHAEYLYAINAKTGELVESFGEQGRIHYATGIDVDASKKVRLTTPGVIYKDLIISGSFVSEFLPSAPGDIRAFNAVTGKLEWVFHTIPHPEEFGYDTWPEEAHKKLGGANNWAGMSLDTKRGIVYVPTGSATYDFYGANRKGKNLFANTLLALDANTGKRVWHYQIVHHDLWDRDLPCAPNLLTVEHDGKKIDAVAQPTKQGFVFLFNRETGEPLFDIEEVPVPQSTIPGEQSWPTQPIPKKPPPFVRQVFKKEDVAEFSTASKDYILNQLKKYKTAMFTPPDTLGVVLQPGVGGGANWGGAAVHEPTSNMIIYSVELPNIIRLVDRHKEFKNLKLEGKSLYNAYCASCHGKTLQGGHYVPALQNLKKKYNRGDIEKLIREGKGTMPPFEFIDEDQREAIAAYVLNQKFEFDDRKKRPGFGQDVSNLKYTIEGYESFDDQLGRPAIKPPWGTLTAIDMNKGVIKWQIPLGKNDEYDYKGVNYTGADGAGGPLITKAGLVFIAATMDRTLRVFDLKTGTLLWEYKLPGEAMATPSTYFFNGKQYVVIAVTESHNPRRVGRYMAFSLDSK